MTTVSLRPWLTDVSHRIGLLRVNDRVDPAAYEVTAILEQLEERGAPPVLFPNMSRLDGGPSEFGIVLNLYGSLAAVAATLDLGAKDWPSILDGYSQRVLETRAVEVVDHAPVQEHTSLAKEVDLSVLPWVRHVESEGGLYFTPIVVARDPDSGRYNLSWNRAMYLDRRHLAVHISPRHLWSHHRTAEERGEDLPVALILGHHPAFNLGASALTSVYDDEYEVAGALLGSGVRVVPSAAYGEALLVPADAEVIVEGRLLHGRRAVEGPFGEYLRYLGPQKLSHVLEVDAVSWRSRPIVLEIFASHRDHFNACIAIEASLLRAARAAVPQVVGVSWFRGGGPTTLVISIRKSSEGQQTRAAMAAMASFNVIKQVIAVDDDVDIESPSQVLWAISTRLRADEDITIVNNLQGNLLDPSQPGHGTTSGVIFDATKPLGVPFPPVAQVGSSTLAKYPLDRYSLSGGL